MSIVESCMTHRASHGTVAVLDTAVFANFGHIILLLSVYRIGPPIPTSFVFDNDKARGTGWPHRGNVSGVICPDDFYTLNVTLGEILIRIKAESLHKFFAFTLGRGN